MKYFFLMLLFSICLNANAIDRFCNGAPTTIQANGGGNVALTAIVDAAVFVGPSAAVCEYAMVFGTAQVKDNSRVYGKAQVADGAIISGNAEVFGNASLISNPPSNIIKVSENAKIYGNASVNDAAVIKGSAKVFENSRISMSATVDESAQIYGSATITDTSIIKGSARLHGNAFIGLNVIVTGATDLCTFKNYNANTVLTNTVYCLKLPMAIPTITSIVSNIGPISGGVLVTIIGTNFLSGDTVFIGGATCSSVIVINPTTIQCITPAHAAGAVNVIVTNVDSSSGILPNGYTYLAAPTVTSVSPNVGSLVGGTLVTITGNNFIVGATVNFGGSICGSINVVNATTITCTTSAHSAGAITVTVTNTDAQSGTLTNGYTYSATPTVTSVSPNVGPLVGGTLVTITGNNFLTGATVSFGGSVCGSINVVNATTITCTTSAHSAGAITVTVTNTDAQSGTLTNGYTYRAAPTVASVSPNGGALTGGAAVTITGSNFLTGATVSFGGSICGSINVVNATTITCTTSAHSAGAITVTVTNTDAQSGTLTNGYTYRAAPTVTSVSPNGGALAGGAAVTITGSNFLTGATVSIGGSVCGSINVVSATTITCTTSAHSAGTFTVIVTNTDTQSGTFFGYTYRAGPAVFTVSPKVGLLAGGTAIVIAGNNFMAGATVDFGGSACTNVNVLNVEIITCTTTAHTAGAVTVGITNPDGQLGTASNAYTYKSVLSGIAQLGTGGNHTCARLNSGTVRCWGRNVYGQLGYGSTTNLLSPGADINLGGTAAQVVAGFEHTCALLSTGAVRCWGWNEHGQLGYGNTANLLSPGSDINLGGVATQVSAGAAHTCALLNTGAVKCWGNNERGQLGYGSTTNLLSPGASINLGGTATQISAGGAHTCALLTTGMIKCWGNNDDGELGYGNTTQLLSPGPDINLGGTVTQISVGGTATCALLNTGVVRCWGNNLSGQLGYGNTTSLYSPGPAINLGGTATQMIKGEAHTCALLTTGVVKCWGQNQYGQLGYGNTSDLYSPGGNINLGVAVVTQISINGLYSCVLLNTGTIRCWGNNYNGQLGYGTVYDLYSPGGDVSSFVDNFLKHKPRKNYIEIFQNNKERYWSDNE